MNESIVHDGMLTLRNERGSLTLSQGQCAAIVCMAEMHNKPVASPSCSSCVHEESCKEHGVNLGPVECGDEYMAKPAQPSGDDADWRMLVAECRHVEEAGGGMVWIHGPERRAVIAKEAEAVALRAKLADAEAAYDMQHKAHVATAADRDRLAAQVAELTRENQKIKADLETHQNQWQVVRVIAERDKALADLAACKDEHSKQIEFKIKECEMLDRALRRTKDELAAERERREHDNAKSEVYCDVFRAKADDAKADLAEAEANRPRWIKCSERMPGDLVAVLCACTETDDGLGPAVYAGFRANGRWISQDKSGIDDPLDSNIAFPVSHWMPLPEPPTDNEAAQEKKP